MSEVRLIDANALRAALRNGLYEQSASMTHAIALLEDLLRDAPTIDPVRHGHWVAWNGDRPIWLGCFCSVCKNHADSKFAFCPNCGARMDLEG